MPRTALADSEGCPRGVLAQRAARVERDQRVDAAERRVGRAIAKRDLHDPRAFEALRLSEADGWRRENKPARQAHGCESGPATRDVERSVHGSSPAGGAPGLLCL